MLQRDFVKILTTGLPSNVLVHLFFSVQFDGKAIIHGLDTRLDAKGNRIIAKTARLA